MALACYSKPTSKKTCSDQQSLCTVLLRGEEGESGPGFLMARAERWDISSMVFFLVVALYGPLAVFITAFCVVFVMSLTIRNKPFRSGTKKTVTLWSLLHILQTPSIQYRMPKNIQLLHFLYCEHYY